MPDFRVVAKRSDDVWLLSDHDGPHDRVQVLDLSLKRLHPPVDAETANGTGHWEPIDDADAPNVEQMLRDIEVMPDPYTQPYIVGSGFAG